MKTKPLISIITVVFNGKKFLERTIKSVLSQTHPNIEYIIIDGGSTDGTVDIIKKYDKSISYWVSEKDNGIYDAMNKGLKVATGKYIGILNADDYYAPNAVELSLEKLAETNTDYSVAKVQFFNSKVVATPIFPLKKSFIYQEMMYPHIGAFISKVAYEKVGLFDTSYKIAGDFDMALKIHLANFEACYVDSVIGFLEEGGVSSSTRTNEEFMQVSIAHGKSKLSAYLMYIKQLVNMKLHSILPKTLRSTIMSLKNSRYKVK
ncbi:MAG: glycosyltransferase [Helicobacteraceae bacterium]|nr:glycosyltransferase [Helicobacteraceae bacterium]